MNKSSENRLLGRRIAYTLLVAVLLCALYISVLNYVYSNSEEEAYNNLHVETGEYKSDITLQLLSDRENLQTMANFASKLYSDGENFQILFDSFKSIGLIENIAILLPDNSFITRIGVIENPAGLDFESELKKGKNGDGVYISGIMPDATNSERKAVRSAVPVVAEGKAIAILYGVIELSALESRYIHDIQEDEAQLYIIERGNGNFIINTKEGQLNNVTSLSDREYKDGYTYEALKADIDEGKSGYSSFVSKFTDDVVYVHYSPLDISDWQIMLVEPERNVFRNAHRTRGGMLGIFAAIIVVMTLYISLMFASERKMSRLTFTASNIRRNLLEINQQFTSINDSLKKIAMFSKARSAFFIDSDGEDFCYIHPSHRDEKLDGDDRRYFILKLFNKASSVRREKGISMSSVKVIANKELKQQNPKFYEFMCDHGIKRVCFVYVGSKKDTISIIGVINPYKNAGAVLLLREIAVCFSMSIYNKKHLEDTETIALTDSLTSLSNRMAYKKKLDEYSTEKPENIACVYMDVNELHVINNKYGHDAGDGMLLFVANAIKEVFGISNSYRIGGDEFLVFVEDTSLADVNEMVAEMTRKTEEMNYHVSAGVAFRDVCFDTEQLVKDAEKMMYELKAHYYRKKEHRLVPELKMHSTRHIITGIDELDATLTVIGTRFNGIYCVSLKNDTARSILMPEYIAEYEDAENSFSKSFSKYISDKVQEDDRPRLSEFMNYPVLKKQLFEGYVPSITYTNTDGDSIMLSVYLLDEKNPTDNERTLWTFEKKYSDTSRFGRY